MTSYFKLSFVHKNNKCFAETWHPSHWGKICYISTPDGENCGLIKNLAVGSCKESASFVAEFRRKRRRKEVPRMVEIKEDTKNKEVSIFCDAGRVLRPLLVQNLHKFRLLKGGSHSIQDLLDSGIVELIGPKEEEDCRTAWEASILNQAQKEQNHRPSRGGNFPLGAGHKRLCKQMTKNIVVNMTLPEIQCLVSAATDGHLIFGLLV
ncbi:DNA-directed RNA polymerases IV and V subunit 2-like protein [Tanacetum coccineum]